ncbi:MAG: type II secretion system F family protein [Candidatus Delongbacteria bacterium]
MPKYNYVIRNAAGQRVESSLTAATFDAALEVVKNQGTLIQLKEVKADQVQRVTVLDKINAAMENLKNHVPLKVMVFFTRQLSTMFSAGLTLEKAIGNLAREERNKKFKRTLMGVHMEIKQGLQLSDAMAHYPYHFNSLYVALTKAGEVSGSLHTVLQDMADYLETVEDTRQEVKGAMYYPIFMFGFLLVVVFILLWKIIPQFTDIYTQLGATLPAPTRLMVTLSDIIAQNFFISVFGILFVSFWLWVLTLTDRGELVLDQMLLKLPVFGGLIHDSVMNKFAKTLGILFGSGVTVTEALKLVQGVVGNAVVSRGVGDLQEMLKEGYSLSNAMIKTSIFPPTLIQLTQTGEETGELDTLLKKAAEFYQKQVESVITRLTSLIEPMMIIGIGVVIATIVVVIYLPVFEFGQAVQQLGY